MPLPNTESPATPVQPAAPEVNAPPTAPDRRRLLWFALFVAGLSLAFFKPLLGLVRYGLHADLHSHVVLIPFISIYLVWLQRKESQPAPASSPALAVLPLVFGLLALQPLLLSADQLTTWKINDYLALTTFAYVCLLWSGALFLLGSRLLRVHLFPVLFLVFLVPLPTAAENAIEIFFQYASAEASALMFAATGTTLFRDGLLFQLPGISMQVAQECSGIRSSLVLFITSLVAGHMFLRSPWRRAALTLFVIPLAIVRNGFRIVTIGLLCVHVSPTMIDSVIHSRGGPLFFALSLIPFFLFLLWLRWRERRKPKSKV